jgi:hypothetical protein
LPADALAPIATSETPAIAFVEPWLSTVTVKVAVGAAGVPPSADLPPEGGRHKC